MLRSLFWTPHCSRPSWLTNGSQSPLLHPQVMEPGLPLAAPSGGRFTGTLWGQVGFRPGPSGSRPVYLQDDPRPHALPTSTARVTSPSCDTGDSSCRETPSTSPRYQPRQSKAAGLTLADADWWSRLKPWLKISGGYGERTEGSRPTPCQTSSKDFRSLIAGLQIDAN